MDVGNNCIVSDKWIPDGISTGLLDTEGILLKTRDNITLTGCTSRNAIIGRDSDGDFMIYFGGRAGSVGWHLDEERIIKNNVKVVRKL